MLTREQFRGQLQDALNHMHDPERLGRNPLARLFGVADHANAYIALQDILTEAIAALKPSADVPADARAWRIYDLLSCRYVQELSPPEVAHQLGLSTRHMHREQAAALDVLARRLREEYHVADAADEGAEVAAAASLAEELAWLRDAPCEPPADLNEVLGAVLELAGPLAQLHGTRVQAILPDRLPGVAVHPVGLNQVLLNLLTTSIHRAGIGTVEVSARQIGWEVEVGFCSAPACGGFGASPDGAHIVEATEAVADLCGMVLTFSEEPTSFAARVLLPAHQQAAVLAIDDNADTLALLERYTVGSRYRLVGVQDPERALQLAEALQPQVIVLDVMMPQIDGWRLLGRLRQHPATHAVPIVVCTIVAQEELAFTLGAAACLLKPITQEQFLEALDQQVAPQAPGSG